MGEDYRESVQRSRMTGEAIRHPYQEHCKEVLLKLLRGRLDSKEANYEQAFVGENTENEDMLWILKRDEKMEHGIYSWNRPEVDLVIVASPPLMALVMGEYSLAASLWRQSEMPLWRNSVEELYQDGKRAEIGGGCYSFGEACLLSRDMSFGEKQFFWEKGCYDMENMALEGDELLSEAQFHRSGRVQEEDYWHVVGVVKELNTLFEGTERLLSAVVKYSLKSERDRSYGQFWKKIYEMFPSREAHFCIVEAMHDYFVRLCSANSLSPHYEARVLEGVRTYFQYEDSLPMTGAIEVYLVERFTTKSYISGVWKTYLEQYLELVKDFEGNVSLAWQYGMYELLKLQDEQWLKLGFQCGFLRSDCIKEYIDYLLQERLSTEKHYSKLISRLIQLRWKAEGVRG